MLSFYIGGFSTVLFLFSEPLFPHLQNGDPLPSLTHPIGSSETHIKSNLQTGSAACPASSRVRDVPENQVATQP